MVVSLCLGCWTDRGLNHRRGPGQILGVVCPTRENTWRVLSSAVSKSAIFRCGKNLASLPDADKTRRLSPKREELAELCPARENAPSLSAPKKLAESLPAPDNFVELFCRAGEARRVCPAPGRLAELFPRRENSPKFAHAGIAINENIKITSWAPPLGRAHVSTPLLPVSTPGAGGCTPKNH